MPATIDVVGAVIREGDRVLIAQRPPGKANAHLWEFPGGKPDPGEDPREALVREIREELGCEIAVEGVLGESCHDAENVRIRLVCYWARLVSGTPRTIECQDVRWVSAAELRDYAFTPADVPLVAELAARLSTSE